MSDNYSRDLTLNGYINIEECEFSGNFVRRYFVMDNENKKVLYYMDNPNVLPETWKNPVGEFYLQHVNKVVDARNVRPKVPFCFSISVAGIKFFLQAPNLSCMKQWVETLHGACRIAVALPDTYTKGTEWCDCDVSNSAYVTQIAGGVVCKLAMHGTLFREGSRHEELHNVTPAKISSNCPMFSDHVSKTYYCDSKLLTGNEIEAKNIFRAGYAVKQGGVRKNWKRRYFILHDKGLSYFKTENDKLPIKTVSFSDILHVCEAHIHIVNRDNLFELKTPKRLFFIQCDSPDIMYCWIKEINDLIAKIHKTSDLCNSGNHDTDLSKSNSSSIWV